MLRFVIQNKLLIFIFLLALFLRTYRLGELPMGLHADEARVAWNTYSILHTGADDRGNSGALYYNTFGDYRPTGIFYLTIPSIALFGLEIWATRLPSALLGALTIFPLYLFVLKITNNKNAALFSAFFLSIIPWHITASRSTSEVVISLFFCLLGITLLQKKYFWPALLSLSLSIFLYHSARIVVPIFVLVFFIQQKTQKTFLLFAGLCTLTLFLSINPESRSRFSQVSLLSDPTVLGAQTQYQDEDRKREELVFHNRPGFYINTFLDEYTRYFSTQFLTNHTILPTRYGSGAPLMSYTALLFVVMGGVYLIKQGKFYIFGILLAVAVIPAALTAEDSPNMHRALFMTPFLASLAGLGFTIIQKYKTITYILLLIFCLQVFSFWHMYRKHSGELIAESRNVGAFEVLTYLEGIDDNYDTILLPNEPDSLYPWFGIHYRLNPQTFNTIIKNRDQGTVRYANYEFTLERCPSDKILNAPSTDKLLIVDRGTLCPTESKIRDGVYGKILTEIYYPNGKAAYTIWQGSEELSTSTQ